MVFKSSWSRIFLPLPGARVVIVTGADFPVAAPLDRARIETLSGELTARLILAQGTAERVLQPTPK